MSEVSAQVSLNTWLQAARGQLNRVDPAQLAVLLADGNGIVLDTRTPTDRQAYGCIPGSIHTPRTVLEWRVALDAPLRIPSITSLDQLLVIVCNEGYSSSLAAVSLQQLGFHRATDLVGGVIGWRDAGLPMVPPSDDEIGLRNDLT